MQRFLLVLGKEAREGGQGWPALRLPGARREGGSRTSRSPSLFSYLGLIPQGISHFDPLKTVWVGFS